MAAARLELYPSLHTTMTRAPDVRGFGDPVRARGIEPPLQHVAVHHHGTRKLAVALPLLNRPRVDHQRPGRHLRVKIVHFDTVQASTRVSQDPVDRRRWCEFGRLRVRPRESWL